MNERVSLFRLECDKKNLKSGVFFINSEKRQGNSLENCEKRVFFCLMHLERLREKV
jgi:hypothetical protein